MSDHCGAQLHCAGRQLSIRTLSICTFICAALLAGVGLLSPLAAQDTTAPPPAAAATDATSSEALEDEAKRIGRELVPVRIRARVRNATAAGELHSQGGGAPRPQYFESVPLRIFALDSGGQNRGFDAKCGADGLLEVDLGRRYKDSEIDFYILLTDRVFRAVPLTAGAHEVEEIAFYSIATDPAALAHQVSRVVTVQGAPAGGGAAPSAGGEPSGMIHVRQIVQVGNQSFHVFQDLPDGGYVFPVPAGAEVQSLRVNGLDWLDRTVAEHVDWGHGIVIRLPIFPVGSSERAVLNIMGTLMLPLAEGGALDLDLESPVGAGRYTLALDKSALQFAAAEQDDGGRGAGGQALTFAGEQGAGAGITVPMKLYQGEVERPNQRLAARIVRGRPPVDMSTILVAVLIIGGLLFSVVVGLLIARRTKARSAAAGAHGDGEALEDLLAAGRISVEEFEHRSRAAPDGGARANSSAPPGPAGEARRRLLEALRSLERRSGSSNEELARDLRELVRALERYHEGAP